MKQCVRCSNCEHIMRRSWTYKVQVTGMRNTASMLEKPQWEAVTETVYLCKSCAPLSGYTVHKSKEKEEYVEQIKKPVHTKTKAD